MNGIITFYLNCQDNNPIDVVEVFRVVNKELIQQIHEETGYRVAVVPTTNESCRVDKIAFENNLIKTSLGNNNNENQSDS